MSLEILDCDQGSEIWLQARCGIVTASRFSDVLAGGQGKTRGKYLNELAAEIIRGTPEPDPYSNAHMERGHQQEDDARKAYAFLKDADPQRVGFLRNGRVGASPDSLIGDKGGLEIKSALGHIQIDRLKRGLLPSEHAAQVHGCIWLAEREWWDFVSYSPGLPLFVTRVHRDDAYVSQLAKSIEAFTDELDALVASIRTYQDFGRQAAA